MVNSQGFGRRYCTSIRHCVLWANIVNCLVIVSWPRNAVPALHNREPVPSPSYLHASFAAVRLQTDRQTGQHTPYLAVTICNAESMNPGDALCVTLVTEFELQLVFDCSGEPLIAASGQP